MNIERAKKILTLLSENEYRSSERLASELALSSKTIRNEIKLINDHADQTGTKIQTSPRKGMRLLIEEREKYSVFMNMAHFQQPTTPKERVNYLVSRFLQAPDWIKIEDLSDQLYISTSSLSADLKEVRSILDSYNIQLVSRPGYGLQAEGSEFDLRLCLASHVIESQSGLQEFKRGNLPLLKQISELLNEKLSKHNFQISSTSLQNLLIHIYITLQRMESTSEPILDAEHQREIMEWPEYELAEEIARSLFTCTKQIFPPDEICYIAIHLASKRILNANDHRPNMMISSEIFELSGKMIEQIKTEYGIDFTDDFDLRMMLSLHMVPLDIRIQYDMVLHNPLLKDIKTRYPLAYNMAVTTSTVINSTYHTKLREDEVGYLALHFNLALERKRRGYEKKNIVIVCATGRGTSQMLSYIFRSKFGDYLSSLKTADLYSLPNMDLSGIDYVFSTVDLSLSLPVPVIKISSFMEEDNEVRTVRQVLKETPYTLMENYFDPELFFTDSDLKSREEVLAFLDREIRKKYPLPDDFIDLIMERENLAGTEFFNLIAMPHPVRPVTAKTFAAVLILKKPILWDRQKIQFVFMLCMENNMDRNLMDFYQLASRLLVEPSLIQKIINSGQFKTLLEVFATLEEEMRQEEEL